MPTVCTQLRALDLGGNPCSRESEGYKFQVVRVLPRLKTLDGDQITQLDKDLSEDFAVHGGNTKKGNKSTGSSKDFRPFTAPAAGGDRLRGSRWDSPTPKGASSQADRLTVLLRRLTTLWFPLTGDPFQQRSTRFQARRCRRATSGSSATTFSTTTRSCSSTWWKTRTTDRRSTDSTS